MDEQRSGDDRRTIPRETERRRGRPRKVAGGNAASTWLTDAEYDAIITIARVNRCSVSEVIARALRISLIEKHSSRQVA